MRPQDATPALPLGPSRAPAESPRCLFGENPAVLPGFPGLKGNARENGKGGGSRQEARHGSPASQAGRFARVVLPETPAFEGTVCWAVLAPSPAPERRWHRCGLGSVKCRLSDAAGTHSRAPPCPAPSAEASGGRETRHGQTPAESPRLRPSLPSVNTAFSFPSLRGVTCTRESVLSASAWGPFARSVPL